MAEFIEPVDMANLQLFPILLAFFLTGYLGCLSTIHFYDTKIRYIQSKLFHWPNWNYLQVPTPFKYKLKEPGFDH